jgi:hypothetical protein
MQKLIITLMFFTLVAVNATQAGETLLAKDLIGNWKITDVQIKQTGKAEFPVTKETCYLCDLYNHNQQLVFGADGKVSYQHDANPYLVQYKIDGNKLILSSTQTSEVQLPEMDAPQRTENVVSTFFEISMSQGVLTIIKKSNEHTETYTLTK